MKNSKKVSFYIIIVFHLLLTTIENKAQSNDWLWTQSIGGPANEMGNSVTMDTSGNVFVAGVFQSESIYFGDKGVRQSDVGRSINMMLVKYDSTGKFQWIRSSSNSPRVNNMTTDTEGNIYIVGHYNTQNATWDNEWLTNQNGFDGTGDVFIVKYNPQGKALWARSAGGWDDERGVNIRMADSGNFYITGSFKSPAIIFGTDTLKNTHQQVEDYDLFIAKYDRNGMVVWAKSAGGTGEDAANSATTDNTGNMYLTGFFATSITFGTTTLKTSTKGDQDIFLVKYDSKGNVLWAKSAGSKGKERAYRMVIDNNGDNYIAGDFESASVTFGPYTVKNSAPASNDIFLVKYNSQGVAQWAKTAGGVKNDVITSMAIDNKENIYITGNFNSRLLSFENTTVENADSLDLFIAKYDVSGNLIGAKSIGGNQNDVSNSITADKNGDVYLTGYFISPTINFGIHTINNSSYSAYTDLFLAKLSGIDGTFSDIGEFSRNHNTLGVFPNPAKGVFSVSGLQGANVHFTLYTIMGEVIHTCTLHEAQSSIRLNGLTNGMYYYQIQKNGIQVKTGKLLLE